MQKSLFEENEITSLGSVDGEDLTPKGGININPSPNGNCCICCGRPQSELTPFVEGVFLGKNYRRDAPANEVFDRIYDEFFDNCSTDSDFQKAEEKLVQKYG